VLTAARRALRNCPGGPLLERLCSGPISDVNTDLNELEKYQD